MELDELSAGMFVTFFRINEDLAALNPNVIAVVGVSMR